MISSYKSHKKVVWTQKHFDVGIQFASCFECMRFLKKKKNEARE